MKRFKTALSLLLVGTMLFSTSATFAATKSLSLEDAILLSKEHSADIRSVTNQEFGIQNTIRKNIQNSYQLASSLESYYDYISIYEDASENSSHPLHKYIGRSNESLTATLTTLANQMGIAASMGLTSTVENIQSVMGFIQAYMMFGDTAGLTKETKYNTFKKNEAMLQNSIALIQTKYDQGLIAATKQTEAGVIKLYVALKDLEQGLKVQKELLEVYEIGLANMKTSYEQGLVSQNTYENQVRTVEMKRLETENLQYTFDNYSYQMKNLCGVPMATSLNLSTDFNHEDYALELPSTYYERAYSSNMTYVNLQAELAYNEKNFEVMNKYLDDYDRSSDSIKPIYYQEKVDQQETIDDLKDQIENKKLLINTNVTLAYNDLIYKAKLNDHNATALKLAEAQLNSGIQSLKLGQITQLDLDQLKLKYESALMSADQNKRSYDKSVENFQLLLDYGVTYSAE
ncbi:MAG: TolC family protein [Clostridia bacterium]|nr:TolC family protein [Clostridia bacterium]